MKNTRLLFSILFFSLVITAFARNTANPVQLSSLRCEMMTNPQGIGITHPRLSWVITSSERGTVQTAYRIMVASSVQKLATGGDLWDSGKINSAQSVFVPYAGAALISNQTCFWKVKVYTSKGESDWSARSEIRGAATRGGR